MARSKDSTDNTVKGPKSPSSKEAAQKLKGLSVPAPGDTGTRDAVFDKAKTSVLGGKSGQASFKEATNSRIDKLEDKALDDRIGIHTGAVRTEISTLVHKELRTNIMQTIALICGGIGVSAAVAVFLFRANAEKIRDFKTEFQDRVKESTRYLERRLDDIESTLKEKPVNQMPPVNKDTVEKGPSPKP